MRKIIFLTGAGISSASGLATFRDDSDGFWTKYDPDQVCHAMTRKTKEHFDFFNMYRKLIGECQPNPAHFWIATLQRQFGNEISLLLMWMIFMKWLDLLLLFIYMVV